MHRTIRTLRNVVLALLVGFIVVIVILFRRSAPAPREQTQPIKSEIRTQETPRSVAESFDETQTIGGRTVMRVRARRTVGFESGWYTLEDVQLSVYRLDGRTYEVFCPQAQINAETKEAEAKGGVRVTSSDGLEISTDALHFDGNQLDSKIPVKFKVQAFEGSAGGVELNVADESIRLSGGVKLQMAGGPGTPPLDLVAGEAIAQRKAGELTLRGDVRILRGSESVEAQVITARTNTETGKLVSLAADGQITMRVGRDSEVLEGKSIASAIEIRSDGFFGEFDGQGELMAFLAVSHERTHAILFGPVRREIDAKQFRLLFSAGAPSQLQIDGNLELREVGASQRTITADSATMYVDPQTRRPTNGTIAGNVRYRDAKFVATSRFANFDLQTDRVFLTATPDQPPEVVSDEQRLRANLIEVATKEGVLTARGAVVATLLAKKGASSASGNSIFPGGGKPVFVNAESLVIRQKEQAAMFSGRVKAWQDQNTLFADELNIQDSGRMTRAKGSVRAVLYNAREQSASPTNVRSDVLLANRTDHRIDLEGNVRIEDDRQSLSSEKTTLQFSEANKLESMKSEGKVTVVERATNRKGTGDLLTYDVKAEKIVLTGKPASLVDERGSTSGEKIVFDLARKRVDVIRGAEPTESTFKP